MKPRPVDPRRLDVEAFAKDASELEGDWPLAGFERLSEAAHDDARPAESDLVHWHVRGESVPVRGAAPQTWLHLRATARLALVCQRCLAPIDTPIEAERSFLFVPGEEAAAQLDADHEEDVLALTRSLDLRELVEDELLLALPLVPRHELCPHPLPMERSDQPSEAGRPNPFAALATLKRDGPPN
ncbi:DUF177 domain-containing protein [Piscinibacter sp. XHJ-5]|uniref:YceD family protein n=1 Tax=Piscinibacter sp. XHJ-5 TaxID=3037797 RepID=UPI002452E249|nr:DUF177 domain-containing protein [Piscinibacter sp. XHJ-5]